MSADNNPTFKALDAKLHKLIACVLKKAKADATFANELSRILSVANAEDAQVQAKPTSLPPFDSVSFLHQHGEAALGIELGLKPDSDLRAIMKFQGLIKSKESKILEREQMISEIIGYSSRKLKQGSAFLGKI